MSFTVKGWKKIYPPNILLKHAVVAILISNKVTSNLNKSAETKKVKMI
jgi:hypothetical protein